MPRETALRVIQRVMDEGAFSHIALDAELSRGRLAPRDRGLASALVYGVLTWKRALDEVLDPLVKGGLERLDPGLDWILRLGAYQLLGLDTIPAHAAVDESVRLARKMGHSKASGLVNGVLRNVVRRHGSMRLGDLPKGAPQTATTLGKTMSLPTRLAQQLINRLGWEEAVDAARAMNAAPPIFAHTPQLTAPPAIEETLPVEGIPGALRADRLGESLRAEVLAHRMVVQDLGSQLICWLAGAQPGWRVLDACAGLGGKTLHLAAQVGDEGQVVAVEPLRQKLELLRQGAEAAGLQERVMAVRGTLQSYAERPREAFDLVILDAPCSGLGVIRRHPETRWNRSVEDVSELAALQRELLDAAAALVKPGGALLYAVCTFTREEGPDQLLDWLDAHPEFTVAPPDPETTPIDWSRWLTRGALITWPHQHGSDAFFAARLVRRPEDPPAGA